MSVMDRLHDEAFITKVFNLGYHAGHEDTVEARYVDIHYSELDTYHNEEVIDIIKEEETK